MIWTWWILAIVPIAWFLQNIIHEGSHALIGKYLCKYDLLRFKFWPHNWYHWKWFIWLPKRFASYHYTVPIRYLNDLPRHHQVMLYAPVFGAALWFSSILILTICVISPNISIFGIPFMVCALIDMAFWFWGFIWGSEQCDGKQLRKVAEI